MNYLKISNRGHIDIKALTLLGGSTKRGDDSKVGRFGSGNKYAIAYLLRNNFEVQIYAGLKKIDVAKKKITFGKTKMEVIVIDGAETSITTDFGPDWSLWQSIREVWSNSIDEGGHKIEYVSAISPMDGETHFYIKNKPELSNFIADFDNYFADNRKVLFECKYGRILEKGKEDKLCLFRRGIRCFESDKLSVYDYDLTNVEIDENRLVKHYWQVPSKLWNLIYQCTNKEVIKNILFKCDQNSHVECISSDFANINIEFMSEEYLEVIKSLKMAPNALSGLLSTEERGSVTVLPTPVFEQAKVHATNDNLASKFKVYKDKFYKEIETTPLMQATLDKCHEFLKECHYDIPYPIIVAVFQQKDIGGMARQEDKTIILSEICLEKGVQKTIEVLIEEYIHLKYEVDDETRGFQNAAITEIVKLLKLHHAYPV